MTPSPPAAAPRAPAAPVHGARYTELDSLRGLAALSVMGTHFIKLVDPVLVRQFEMTPFRLLWAGHEAVLLFFVLSGFVLALPAIEGRAPTYRVFLIKRVFRIYLPYLAVLALAIVLWKTVSRGPLPGLPFWFSRSWQDNIDLKVLVDHLLFLGSFENDRLVPVIWSLVYEMRISIVYPFIVAILLAQSTFRVLVIAGLLGGLGPLIHLLWLKSGRKEVDYWMMSTYLGIFLLGFLLARHRDMLGRRFWKLPRWMRRLLFVFGVFIYGASQELARPWKYWSDIPVAIGACSLVITSLAYPRLTALLRLRPLVYLGEISYSVYLLHPVVLLTVVHLTYGRWSNTQILVVSIIGSLLSASACYEWVERPIIAAGRRVAARAPGR